MKSKPLFAKAISLLLLIAIIFTLACCNANVRDEPAKPIAAVENTAPRLTAAPEEAAEEPAEETGGDEELDYRSIRLEDNFYQAINADYLINTQMPAATGQAGPLSGDMENEARARLINDFEAMMKDGIPEEAAYMESVIMLYGLLKDNEAINNVGAEPLRENFDLVEGIATLKDFQARLPDLVTRGLIVPVDIFISNDRTDETKNLVWFDVPELVLGSPVYYEDDNEAGAMLLPLLEAGMAGALVECGYSENEAEKMAGGYVAIEKLIAQYIALQNVQDLNGDDDIMEDGKVRTDEFAAGMGTIDMNAVLLDLIKKTPDEVVVVAPLYYENLDKIINESNLAHIKAWMICRTVYDNLTYLSVNIIKPLTSMVASQYGMSSDGTEMTQAQLQTAVQEKAFIGVNAIYGSIIGYYYGRTYVDEAERAKVISMCEEMLAAHRENLLNNEWLGKETIDMAVKKLDNMEFMVGYPDKLPGFIDISGIEKAAALEYINYIKAQKNALSFKNIDVPIDAYDLSELNIFLHRANASYVLTSNMFYVFAGVINDPLFNIDKSESYNYGGLGIIIGHEISHAFDSEGAFYDENGNLADWWTDEDRAAFNERTKAMVALFDGLPYGVGNVDGSLTLPENIADAGGIKVALSVLKAKPGYDLKEFFEAYASVWRNKMTPQTLYSMLMTDVHAPAELRVNVQCSNCDDFYEAYAIAETDDMYLAPENRIYIW